MARQKRSENTYQKINGVFYRDVNNIIMPYDELCDPALNYLRDLPMEASEKIDGTNIRIEVTRDDIVHSREINGKMEDGVCFSVEYKGKTDNANIPKELETYLKNTFTPEKVLNSLELKSEVVGFIPFSEFINQRWVDETGNPDTTKVPMKYTIYGEGYGRKIQKCGGRYIKDGVSFIVFDVKVNDMYLLTETAQEIAKKLGADFVPQLGMMTINQAIEICRNGGFPSNIAEDKTFTAEGIILKTPIGLLDRRGKRVICKVKVCDFEKYISKYGTDQPVEQTRNPHL